MRRRSGAAGLAVLAAVLLAWGAAWAQRPRGHAASITEGMDCSACHTPQGWALAGGSGAARGFDHSRTGFPLTGAHRRSACVDCHRSDQRTVRACAGCHRDAHEGRLGAECGDCHSAVAWLDVRAIERHRRTRLPLSGVHAITECSACHQRGQRRTFSDVPADCYACHEADYRRPDVHPNHLGDPTGPSSTPFPRQCQLCHRPTGWSPATIVPGTLAMRTRALAASPPGHDLRFPLSFGKHRGLPCESCHPRRELPRLVACTGCHTHAPARLASQHRAVAGGGARAVSCLGCHPGGSAR